MYLSERHQFSLVELGPKVASILSSQDGSPAAELKVGKNDWVFGESDDTSHVVVKNVKIMYGV